MNSRVILPVIASSCVGFFSGLSSAQNATPAPPPPPLASKGKEAERAAAIQPPQVILPLPVPKLTNSEERAPGKRLVPIAVPAGTPPKPADSVPASVKASGALKPASTPDGLTPSASSLPPVIGAPPKRQPPVPTIPRAAQPPVPPDSPAKMTKDDALDAATRDSKLGIEAPRIPTPADRVPVVSSTSASGQFRVHGSDLNLRSRMSSHLDEISKELRAALKDGEVHVIPINVRLSQGEEAVKATSAGAPPVGVQITEVEGGGFHLQLDIREVPTLKLADIRRETVRVLLAERILRGHKSATPSNERLLLPDWIFTGTMQTLDFRSAERPLTMFAAIFKSGRIYGIEEIIEASPVEMDSLSRTIYETSCGALVMALIDQPDGGRRFNKFLNALAVDAKPERELLNAAFPGFAASASSLNKWWSLQMASLAKRRVADPLNADETIRALEDAITIRYVAKTEDVPKDIKKRPFEVPASLFIPPPSKPKPPAPSLDEMASILAEKSPEKKSSSKPVSKNKPEDALDDNSEDASVSKTEGSPWLRYLTFGLLGGKKQDSKSEPDKDGNAETEEKTVAKADTASAPASKRLIGKEETGSSGFLARLISRDNLKAAAERQKTADETARAKKEADEKDAEAKTETEAVLPKREKSKTESSKAVEAEIKEKPKSEGNDRGSLINPLNWFRGTKKPAQLEKEPPKEKSDKSAEPEESNSDDKKSALHTSLLPSLNALADWHSTPLAELWSYFSEWELRRSFLDFLKRKKPKDGDAKEDAKDKVSEGKSQPAPPAAAKKKDEPKPRIKSPPQTTNPNARPAAKPVKTADGSPRTTNPAAKPVPLPQAPPATSPAKDEADTTLPTLPPGSQWVEIHIEDYKHILNRPDREKILDKNANALRVLHEQASILLRPVILGYLSIVADLKEGKTKDIDKRLQDLRTFTMVCAQQTKAVRDYVDYYEANETEQLSGKFNDFLDLPNIIQKELPPREDPLARYLDAIDKEFSK